MSEYKINTGLYSDRAFETVCGLAKAARDGLHRLFGTKIARSDDGEVVVEGANQEERERLPEFFRRGAMFRRTAAVRVFLDDHSCGKAVSCGGRRCSPREIHFVCDHLGGADAAALADKYGAKFVDKFAGSPRDPFKTTMAAAYREGAEAIRREYENGLGKLRADFGASRIKADEFVRRGKALRDSCVEKELELRREYKIQKRYAINIIF